MVRKLTVVVDTNVYFSALYNPVGNEARLLKAAAKGELLLISPDTVREELTRILVGKLDYSHEEADSVITLLPSLWIPREEYGRFLAQARSALPHEEDSPILASALLLKAMILTGDKKHFDRPEILRKTRVISSRELLRLLRKLAKGPLKKPRSGK